MKLVDMLILMAASESPIVHRQFWVLVIVCTECESMFSYTAIKLRTLGKMRNDFLDNVTRGSGIIVATGALCRESGHAAMPHECVLIRRRGRAQRTLC